MDIKRLASWRSLVLGLAVLGLAVVACRGNTDEGDQTNLAPTEQQVLRLRLQAEPKTIDPHLSGLISEASLIKPLFAGLFTYDEGAKIIANLATELPTVAKLAQAGYVDGEGFPKVTFVMVNSDSNRIAGQFVQSQLKENVGIDSEFEYVDGKAYGQKVFGERDYQVTIQSWSADWPYPDNWLPELFGSESSSNIFNYSNPEFDVLMAKAAAETYDAKRLEFYDKGHKLMIDDAGLVPLYNRVSYVLVKPWVKDLVITSLDGAIKGDYHLSRTWIAAPSTAVAAD